ncbi:MAG: isoprenylcysteine carboxylmethyltransferase family protein [Desulfobacterales bacterium]|nr:isoprenylcysteine carboxylmethyltransferase family protein [Desulfobacterales bacterium]MCP4161893.1 isoprenylcysteine carboxylmethyltransferase family protein [Deltaproteobacteria bacterium]
MNKYRKDIIAIFLLTSTISFCYVILNFSTFISPAKVLIANILVLIGFMYESLSLKEDKIQSDDNGVLSCLIFCTLTLFISFYRYLEIWPVMPDYLWNYLFMIGILFFITGLIFRVKARYDLNENFTYTVQIREDHKLVKTGIYSIVRHPAYLGTFLTMIGITLMFGVYLGFLLMLICSPFTLIRIHNEEKLLIGYFGDDYISYKNTTGLFPFLNSKKGRLCHK